MSGRTTTLRADGPGQMAERFSVKPGFQAKEWVVVSRLGGGYGDVYKVRHSKTNELGAMKIENTRRGGASRLLRESKVFKALEKHTLGARNVAQMLLFCADSTLNYLIVVLLGPTLRELRSRNNNKLSLSTVVRIAIQSLLGIKGLHDVGMVHRHLKPSSFMFGLPEVPERARAVYLADFQVAKRFLRRVKNNVGIFREEKDPSFVRMRGYVRYVSVNVHNGNEHRCRDDLWSWLYIFAELLEDLPWQNVRIDPIRVQVLKMITPDAQLFSSVKSKDAKVHLLSIPEYIRTLHVECRPDYAGIHKRLKNAMICLNCKFTDPYDWESGEQSVDFLPSDAELQKFFSHEEMQIVRQADNDQTSIRDESSQRPARANQPQDESLELATFLEVEATQEDAPPPPPPVRIRTRKAKQLEKDAGLSLDTASIRKAKHKKKTTNSGEERKKDDGDKDHVKSPVKKGDSMRKRRLVATPKKEGKGRSRKPQKIRSPDATVEKTRTKEGSDETDREAPPSESKGGTAKGGSRVMFKSPSKEARRKPSQRRGKSRERGSRVKRR